ncbi:LamG-like jellyroll fold domain-containing protein [Longimicrobium sp.]|uniref:LamG-like jellyroll fold domain-containing protein n=1 Tax=Longimicrobium sp. TaxID=2029185 RepID=UPI003B3ABEA6
MVASPPSYLSTHFPGNPNDAVATLGYTPGVSLNGSVPYSIQFFVNFDALSTSGVVIGQPGVVSVGNAFDAIVVSMTGWQPVTTDPTIIPLVAGTWHFVAVTFDGAFLDIYIDGIPAGAAQPVRTDSFGWSNAPWICGRGLKGRVRGIQLFRYARQQSQINMTDFDAPMGSLPSGLVQYYDFGRAVPCTLSETPVTLGPGVEVVPSVVSLRTAGFAWAQPVLDTTVNPAGEPSLPYSVQAWIKVDAATDPTERAAQEIDMPVQVIFANSDPSGAGGGMSLQIAYTANDATAVDLIGVHGSGSGAATVTVPAALGVDQWTNVAMVCDGKTVTMYVNGEAQTPSGTANTIPALADGLPSVAGIPTTGTVGALTLQGNVCSLSVWAVALQQSEIQSNMAAVPSAPSTSLVAYYGMAQNPEINGVTGSTLSLIGGGRITDRPDPTLSVVEDAPNPRVTTGLGPAPDEQSLIEMLRATADRRAVAAGVVAHLERVRAALPTTGASVQFPRGVLRRAHAEIEFLLETASRDPFDLPAGVLVRHEHRGEVFLVHHFSAQSILLARSPVGSPNCDQLFGAAIVASLVLLLNVVLEIVIASMGNIVRAVAELLDRGDPASLAAVRTAITKVVLFITQENNWASFTSLAAWGSLIRVLFAQGFMTAAFYAIVSASGWLVAIALSARFATFVFSWPVQVGLMVARLVINSYGVVTAWLAYSQCQDASSSLSRANGDTPAPSLA